MQGMMQVCSMRLHVLVLEAGTESAEKRRRRDNGGEAGQGEAGAQAAVSDPPGQGEAGAQAAHDTRQGEAGAHDPRQGEAAAQAEAHDRQGEAAAQAEGQGHVG